MGKLGKKIKVAESRMVQHQEEYLENVLNNAEHTEAEQQKTLTPDPLPLKGEGVITAPAAQPAEVSNNSLPLNGRAGVGLKAKKTENGIVINVPMADYMQLTMMKIQTGRTLKDLALQAIHEFVERNRQ